MTRITKARMRVHRLRLARASEREPAGVVARFPVTGGTLVKPDGARDTWERLGRVAIELPYPYVSGNRAVRHGKNGHRRSEEYVAYLADVKREVMLHGLVLGLTGPLHMHFDVKRPSLKRRRDSDNLTKSVSDSLVHAGLLSDDNDSVITSWSGKWHASTPNSPGSVLVTLSKTRGTDE